MSIVKKHCDSCRRLLMDLAGVLSYDDRKLTMPFLEKTARLQKKASCSLPEVQCNVLKLIEKMVDELKKMKNAR